MGYSTDFTGQFMINPPLDQLQVKYINAFSATRRMSRNPQLLGPDPIREAVGLPTGAQGQFFVAGSGFRGQHRDISVVQDYPPPGQPGLWCQWVVTDNGAALQWDGQEKFYNYVKWLKYMIEEFFKPWGRTLHGVVTWSGQDSDDIGRITIDSNQVKVQHGRVVYE